MVKFDEFATTVARFNADSDRANLNYNRNPQNSKSKLDENAELGIAQVLGHIYKMKTYKNLYGKLCSLNNLEIAFKKARKGKTKRSYVIKFKKNLEKELKKLQDELISLTYYPKSLKRIIIRDPKTRVIHTSAFRDRVIHHALINIIEPLFEKIFIYDSYANRKNKGTLKAVQRFDYFKRKVSKNGKLLKSSIDNNQVSGYCLKADIKHYFDEVDHNILIEIIKRKIKDEKVILLIEKILKNKVFGMGGGGINGFENKGMPLGNLTSQFFANVYLNELDYFVKHNLKAKYYIRYVDDFIILHQYKEQLEIWKQEINNFLKENLKLELHSEKSRIIPLSEGIDFVGFRNFYHYKLLRKRNIRKVISAVEEYKKGEIPKEEILEIFQGWQAYAKWANTYKLRKQVIKKIYN